MRRFLVWGVGGVALIAAAFAAVQIRSAARSSSPLIDEVSHAAAADLAASAPPAVPLQTVSHERAAHRRPQTTIPRSAAPVTVSPNPFEPAAGSAPQFNDPFAAPLAIPADGFQPDIPVGSIENNPELANVPVDALNVVLMTRREQLRAAFERKLSFMLANEMDAELATLQTEIRELQAQTEFRKIQERLMKLQAELPETGPARAALRMLEVPVSRAVEQKMWIEESPVIPANASPTNLLPTGF